MKLNQCLACGTLLAAFMTLPFVALAQPNPQRTRANMTGAPGDGRCTFEVEVDGTAEVEIHGDQGDLRTISGAPSRWRRLECNQPLPNNPVGFRFQGVDGRGRQDLVRDPNSSGGVAVIRIDDPQGGSAGYTGEITWRGGNSQWGGVGNWGGVGEGHSGGDAGEGRGNGYAGDRHNGNNWPIRITQGEALNICRNQVVATRNVPRSRVSVRPVSEERDGDYNMDFSFANGFGRPKNGSCSVSGSGQILKFQVEQDAAVVRVTLNQALNICQDEAARNYGVPGDNIRVQHGLDPGNGSYLINFQVQQRNGRVATGACRISPIGEIEDFRRW